ncbi:MAG: HAD family hydrolase [Calditrichae bacterium]|nr:HAD family hydrolase [Calditrichota bacterium]MCB0315211.1 HAD family hydrolase [Calditrichota bacterium]MCB9087091.1 HAD family hydrolase [Calditrichia bacterium]
MNPYISRYRHIIWDWNGTLLDDAWLCLDIMNGMLNKRGMSPLSAARYREIFDFPVIDYYRRIGFDFTREPFEAISTEFITEYNRRKFECRLRVHSREVLNHFSRQGRGQSILSASQHALLERIVQHHDIRHFFNEISGLDDHHAAGKTANARAMIRNLPLPPSEVLLIGDTVHDVAVAEAIGVDCLLIPGGHQDDQRLEASGARRIGCLSDLLPAGEK